MPKHLMFDGRYLNALMSGRKKITIRVPTARIPRPGSRVYVHSGGKVLGVAKITSVLFKPAKALTEREAREEGFRSREELISALKKHYPSLTDDSLVAVIRFEWVKKFDPPLTPEELSWGSSISPVEVALLALKHCRLSGEERKVLELLVREGSIRRAARKLGGLHRRMHVRRILRRVVRRLREVGVLRDEAPKGSELEVEEAYCDGRGSGG